MGILIYIIAMYTKSNNYLKLKKKIFSHRTTVLNRPNFYSSRMYGVAIKKTVRIELNLLKYLLPKLRKIFKKKKILIYITLRPNYILTKKQKNARMGKGSGKFSRFVYRPVQFPLVFFFKNYISLNRVLLLIKSLNTKKIRLVFRKIFNVKCKN